jgi:hypothetical protein
MTHKTVNSTFIASIGYDKSKSLLEVEFTSGEVYKYYGVPAFIYYEFIYASSHGEYFNKTIKTEEYAYSIKN